MTSKVILQKYKINIFHCLHDRVKASVLSIPISHYLAGSLVPLPLLPTLCSRQMRYLPFSISQLSFMIPCPSLTVPMVRSVLIPLYNWPSKLLLIHQGQLRCHIGKHSSLIKSVTVELFRPIFLVLIVFVEQLFTYPVFILLEISFTQVYILLNKQRAIPHWMKES